MTEQFVICCVCKHRNARFLGSMPCFTILTNYEIKTAADDSTLESWIPAEELDSFNENIVGTIDVVAEFRNGQLVKQSHEPGNGG